MSARGARATQPEVAACKGRNCRSKVRWIKTVEGHWVPVELDRDQAGSLTAVQQKRGEWRVRPVKDGETIPAGWPRYTPHWQVCPDAAVWRDDRRRAGMDPTPRPAGRGRTDTHLCPCAGCLAPHDRQQGNGTLCAVCREVLAKWRADPRRGLVIPYPRWNPETGQHEQTRRTLKVTSLPEK